MRKEIDIKKHKDFSLENITRVTIEIEDGISNGYKKIGLIFDDKGKILTQTEKYFK